MSLKLLSILVICGRFGYIDGSILPPDDQSQTWHDFMTSVNLKFDRMERLLAEKDTQIIQIETKLNNEIQKKDSEIAQLKQDLLVITSRQDTILKNIDLNISLDPVTKPDITQQGPDSQKYADDVTTMAATRDVADEGSPPVDGGTPDRQRTVLHKSRQNRVAPSSADPIAFHAERSGVLSVSSGLIIPYDHEVLDQGYGYSPTEGIYTVPESGTYVLTWTTVSSYRGYVRTQLVVNGAGRDYSVSDSNTGNELHSSTGVVILPLQQGNHVYIRVVYSTGPINSDTYGRSTFSGWKLA